MKITLILLLVGLLALAARPALAQQIAFIENKGQWDAQIKLRAKVPNGYMHLMDGQMIYAFYDGKHAGFRRHGKAHVHDQIASTRHTTSDLENGISMPLKAQGVAVQFLGADRAAIIHKSLENKQKCTYFLSGRQSDGQVSSYGQITYRSIYEGIDLKFYQKDEDLKYDLILQPYADPDQIQVLYQGQNDLYLRYGHLHIETDFVEVIEHRPYAYQMVEGVQREVACDFRLVGEILTYEIGEYDPALELVIDPVVFFSTFSESTADNWGNTATYGQRGELISGGTAFGQGFPVSLGAYQVDFEGLVDVALFKYDGETGQMTNATYLGGEGREVPTSIIENSKGELVVLGITGSEDFPVSANAYQSANHLGEATTPVSGYSFDGGTDFFVTVLSADWTSLTGSTFLGGKANEGVNIGAGLNRNYGDELRGEVIVDEDDFIYFTSCTRSIDFPTVTDFPYWPARAGLDALVCKLSPDASDLLFSRLICTAGEEAAYSIALDADGGIYLAGGTSSTSFPTTSGTIHPSFRGGDSDGFVVALDQSRMTVPDQSFIRAATFLGTDRYDQVFLLDIDPNSDELVVFGQTNGSYPVAPISVYSEPNSGQFIHRLSTDLAKSIFSTVIGSGSGSPDIVPTALLVDKCGSIFLAGWGGETNASDPNQQDYLGGGTSGMTTTPDAFSQTTNGSDFYLMILSKYAEKLLFATFFGGSIGRGEHVDGGTSRFSPDGAVYQAVCACKDGDGNNDFPISDGSEHRSSNCNNAALYYSLADLEVDFSYTPEYNCGDLPSINIEWEKSGGLSFQWEVNGQIYRDENPIFEPQDFDPFDIKLTISRDDCTLEKEVTVEFDNLIPPNVITPNGDGKNEYFVIGNTLDRWKLQVYNRWGNLLYESADYQNEWDGGQVPSGVYYYLLTPTAGEPCKGWIKIMR